MKPLGLIVLWLLTGCGAPHPLPQIDVVPPRAPPGSPATSAPVVPPLEGTLVLSLEGALELALKGNVAIQLGRLAVQERAGDWFVAHERFVPLAVLEGRSSQSETPSATRLGGASVVREGLDEGSLRLAKTWGLGTRTDLVWAHQRRSSNSTFLTINPSHSDEVALEIEQPLWGGFGLAVNYIELRKALHQRRLAESDQLITIESELLAVTRRYWDLVLAAQELEIHQQIHKIASEQLAIVADQLEAGVADPLAVSEARAALARQEAQLIEARLNYVKASDDLVSRLRPRGDDPSALQIIPSTSPAAVTPDPTLPSVGDLIRQGLEHRVELKRLNTLIDIAHLDTLAAEDQRRPDLRLLGRYSLDGLDANTHNSRRQVEDSDHPAWSVGLRLSFLLDGDVRRAKWLQALAAQQSRELQERFAREEIVREIRSAEHDLQVAHHRLAASERTREASREHFAAAQDRFTAGRTTSFVIEHARRDLMEAEIAHARAQVDRLLAHTLLDAATGNFAVRIMAVPE